MSLAKKFKSFTKATRRVFTGESGSRKTERFLANTERLSSLEQLTQDIHDTWKTYEQALLAQIKALKKLEELLGKVHAEGDETGMTELALQVLNLNAEQVHNLLL